MPTATAQPPRDDVDEAHCRARGGGPAEDVEAVLARLEAGGPGLANPRRVASEPESNLDAVRQWVTARGWRPGRAASPPPTALAELYAQHAASLGWARDWLAPGEVARCLRVLGWRDFLRGGRRGFRVDVDTAAALALAAPGTATVRRGKRPRRRPAPPKRVAPLFHAVLADVRRTRARPLVDTLGRVWPSARVAASLLPRVHHQDVQRAASRGGPAAGALWRYLTPAEVARVPPMHLSGHVLPALAWRSAVTAHGAARLDACPACGTAIAVAQCGVAPAPSPQASPGPPASMGPAGGPTDIPAPNSDW